MNIKKIIKKINILQQDTQVIDSNNFLNNIGIMCDLIIMNRNDFLSKYYYITSIQYDVTKDLFYANKKNFLEQYYNILLNYDKENKLRETQIIHKELLKEKRGKNVQN